MSEELFKRSNHQCELCSSEENLHCYEVEKIPSQILSQDINAAFVVTCEKCLSQIEAANNSSTELDVNHWRCLSDAIWSEHSSVKALSYKILSLLNNESWAFDLKEQMYLTEEEQLWTEELSSQASAMKVLDSNGTPLLKGDSVTLIKDLDVKGANFTAKRGTLVKNISLTDNPLHIEGKVNGTQIVLVAKFLKKVT